MNEVINLSFFIAQNNIDPLVHGALLSRFISTSDGEYFLCYSSYQESKYLEKSQFNFKAYEPLYINSLNAITSLGRWISKEEFDNLKLELGNGINSSKWKAIYLIKNDLHWKEDIFYDFLYFKLYKEKIYIADYNTNYFLNRRMFITGFIETRGSIDIARNYLSVDFFYRNNFELKKIWILSEMMGVPSNVLNFNFRELQKQYVLGISKRNTQFRINLKWYISNIGLINKYKCEIIENKLAYTEDSYFENEYKLYSFNLNSRNISLNKVGNFTERIIFYMTTIAGNSLDQETINEYREALNFDESSDTNSTSSRNDQLVKFVLELKPDRCAGCYKKYDISVRSFRHKLFNGKRYYFEVHHNISFANDKDNLDDIDNMVKLCPACHRCLKSGTGIEIEQKEIISSILEGDELVKQFAQHYFHVYENEKLVHKIFTHLK
ncbi:HNH endonuclease [Mycoplasma sp. VS299A]|uniref:HNH endonuclease n=1 Tax=Mycoplasma sp. VS299A TaxID=3401690 RepID=UPI003AADBD83